MLYFALLAFSSAMQYRPIGPLCSTLLGHHCNLTPVHSHEGNRPIDRVHLYNSALNGPILTTFLKYLLPSIIGMLAMSSASIVDTAQVMLSQNFGAQNEQRLKQFLKITFFMTTLVSLLTILILLFLIFDDNRFVLALPIGECFTFLIALAYFIRHKPDRAIAEEIVNNS